MTQNEIMETRIVDWWNSNSFLGCKVENIKNIADCFNEFNKNCEENNVVGFKSIVDMIKHYQLECGREVDYLREIQRFKLISASFIDFYLELQGIELVTYEF